MFKRCSKCSKIKPLKDFYKKSNGKLQGSCISCWKDRCKKYYIKNKEQIKKKNSEYQKNNKEECTKRKLNWAHNNLEYKNNRKMYFRNKRRNDIQYRLRDSLRSRIRVALTSYIKKERKGSAVRDLGCNIQQLINYLENKFKQGMSWDNYGNVWHIDHIKPLSLFNLMDKQQFLNAVNYKNLQPMFAADNIRKRDKMES